MLKPEFGLKIGQDFFFGGLAAKWITTMIKWIYQHGNRQNLLPLACWWPCDSVKRTWKFTIIFKGDSQGIKIGKKYQFQDKPCLGISFKWPQMSFGSTTNLNGIIWYFTIAMTKLENIFSVAGSVAVLLRLLSHKQKGSGFKPRSKNNLKEVGFELPPLDWWSGTLNHRWHSTITESIRSDEPCHLLILRS